MQVPEDANRDEHSGGVAAARQSLCRIDDLKFGMIRRDIGVRADLSDEPFVMLKESAPADAGEDGGIHAAGLTCPPHELRRVSTSGYFEVPRAPKHANTTLFIGVFKGLEAEQEALELADV